MPFLEDYFLNPILQNGWFNPVNTLAYGAILVVAVFLVFRLLGRMRIPIDRKFFYAVFPFIVWGSSTRVLHDAAFAGKLAPGLNAFFSSPLFPTPGSYFITFTLAISVLLLSLGLQRSLKIPYWKSMAAIGAALVLLNLTLIPWASALPLAMILGLMALWTGLFFLLSRLYRHGFFQKRRDPGSAAPPGGHKRSAALGRIFSLPNQVILAAHFLDASATYVALTLYGYFEQHVLPRLVFQASNPASFFALKALVIIPVLWAIDSQAGDRNFRNFLKIVVFILGFAPGLRDLIRLMAGV